MLRKLRMPAIVTFLICVCPSTSIATEEPPFNLAFNLDGYWEGFVDRQGAKLGIKVEFKTASDGVKAVIDIPDLYILSLPKSFQFCAGGAADISRWLAPPANIHRPSRAKSSNRESRKFWVMTNFEKPG